MSNIYFKEDSSGKSSNESDNSESGDTHRSKVGEDRDQSEDSDSEHEKRKRNKSKAKRDLDSHWDSEHEKKKKKKSRVTNTQTLILTPRMKELKRRNPRLGTTLAQRIQLRRATRQTTTR